MSALSVFRQASLAFFLLSAIVFFVATAIGMFRFHTLYARLHSAGKSLTGGALSVIIAAMLFWGTPAIIARLFLAALLLLATSTMGTHALARAAHQQGIDLKSLESDAYARAVAGGFSVGERPTNPRSSTPPVAGDADRESDT